MFPLSTPFLPDPEIHESKRQRLIPFPRVGKRQALIPFPRTGKRSELPLESDNGDRDDSPVTREEMLRNILNSLPNKQRPLVRKSDIGNEEMLAPSYASESNGPKGLYGWLSMDTRIM